MVDRASQDVVGAQHEHAGDRLRRPETAIHSHPERARVLVLGDELVSKLID